ncbi:acyltransferase [Ideonella sp. DXS29W]|uniref:Acyltransferase n=1 Tax=Ideonella lacteola TaxID=2984193 RepID=A0ABU9BIE2_9BURK
MPSTSTSSSPRLTELDWLRIGAFGLLILYHCGMFYVSWDWHVKSPRIVTALEPWMRLVSPWRMSLLFVISGAATALMAAGGRPFAASRSRRLLWPLLFGMAVVVPPQAWLEVVEKVGYRGSYLDFLGLYYQGYGGFCRGDDCLKLPTWNHLWFLPYLWVYTVMWALVWRDGGALSKRIDAAVRGLARGGRWLWLPMVFFALARVLLLERFPTTHDLLHDAYMHVVYATMFVLGFVGFGDRSDARGAWAAAQRLRWWALAAAVIATLLVEGWLVAGDEPGPVALTAARALNGVRQWAPILALLGFARRHLAGRDHPWRARLSEAVFPAYIVHQTVTVAVGHLIAPLAWPQPLEAAVLVASTLLACWVAWRLARHARWLRPLMGLDAAQRPRPFNSSAGDGPAPASTPTSMRETVHPAGGRSGEG